MLLARSALALGSSEAGHGWQPSRGARVGGPDLTLILDPTAPDFATGLGRGLRRAMASSSSISISDGARVVIVNDIAGHFEVLASVMVQLHRMQQASSGKLLAGKPRVVFTGNIAGPEKNGLLDWLGQEVSESAQWLPLGNFGLLGPTAGSGGKGGKGAAGSKTSSGSGGKKGSPADDPADLVICVSAELAPQICAAVAAAVDPRLLVVVVHRADTHSKNAKFLRLHRAPLRLMALAPHVANLSRHMLKRDQVDWAMPVAPFVPAKPCNAKACLSGFALQGALRRYRSKACATSACYTRDYAALWRRLLELRDEGAGPVPPVVVVGKGERKNLLLPPELDGANSSVTYKPWLPYPEFWGLIYHSLALVPAFGMPVYYESRISSTILASLVTCVPLIAEQKLLDVYTFMSEKHVFLRQPGEDEAAAMVRVMALPEAEILTRRRAMCELQKEMNERADGLLAQYIQEALATDRQSRR
ncbi:hypothetical protein HYH03_010457 [Edaphochlamys debaryana]|uniref:Glycosyltransferase n=1 Tax=Edaphochlamys debaryana TaxID=47281 RepID=A0A835XWQ3_9CHLO|nr:hypothetical protein HYH03_010457 [Edaphochlamys debaryana]|eukprot:KAG2491250.1 hypothetical protein HYH03_010457 [Edaphochlamys debaryana]